MITGLWLVNRHGEAYYLFTERIIYTCDDGLAFSCHWIRSLLFAICTARHFLYSPRRNWPDEWIRKTADQQFNADIENRSRAKSVTDEMIINWGEPSLARMCRSNPFFLLATAIHGVSSSRVYVVHEPHLAARVLKANWSSDHVFSVRLYIFQVFILHISCATVPRAFRGRNGTETTIDCPTIDYTRHERAR